MATAFVVDRDESVKQQNLLRINPNDVFVDTMFNSRTKRDERAFKAMKESIRQSGVQTPVKLFISDGSEGLPAEGTACVVFGFTRTDIARELYNESNGDEKYLLPYTMIDHVPSRLEALKLNAEENFQRSNLTTWDEVMLIKRFQDDHGLKKPSEVAAVFGKSSAWVTQRLKLATDLHPEIQKRLMLHENDPGFIPGSVAMELVTIENKDEQLNTLKSAELDGAGVATRDKVKQKVSELAEAGGSAPIKAKTFKQLEAFFDSLSTPPTRVEDESDEDYQARLDEYKADPKVPFARKMKSYMNSKTKEKAFVKFLDSVLSFPPEKS